MGALSALLPALLWVGCGDEATHSGDDGGLGGVRALFAPAPGPMAFGAVPWPDDLYLDEEGRISVGELPGEDRSAAPGYHDALRETLADLDGFGAVSPVFFYFDGALDPASLPGTASDSLREDASVFLVDADPGSPAAFTRVAVQVSWVPERRQLALRPDEGHPLTEGRSYAAVVTTRVRSADGRPLLPADAFARIRDAGARPGDTLDATVYDHYTPVLDALAGEGIPQQNVVALAVFHVQTITAELEEARERVWSGDAPAVTVREVVPRGPELDARLGAPEMNHPGLDVPGGVIHGDLGFMVHGTFDSPWMISDEPNVHGRFSRDDAGRLAIRRREDVPFTLFLPRTGELGALPVVVFQHAIGTERSASLAVADVLTGGGYAVLAIDAPFHGMRNTIDDLDVSNRFTGAPEPDLFGDASQAAVLTDFAGVVDEAGELVPFHPVYLRDASRQAVVDLLALTRLVREGDWSAVAAADPALESIGFADVPLAFVGISLGGAVGAMYTAVEPAVGAALLVATGGSLVRLIVESPAFNRGYLPLLGPRIGLDLASIDYAGDHPAFRPEVAIWQTLLDRGDAINFGAALRARPVQLLMTMARHDETLHNLATEALARTVGAVIVGAEPAHADLLTSTAPVRDNLMIGDRMVTRALYVYEPATHPLMTRRRDVSRYAHPVAPPFETVPGVTIDNPVDDAIAQMLHFLESWRGGSAEVAAPTP